LISSQKTKAAAATKYMVDSFSNKSQLLVKDTLDMLTEVEFRNKSNAYIEKQVNDIGPLKMSGHTVDHNVIINGTNAIYQFATSDVGKVKSRYEQIIELRKSTIRVIEMISESSVFTNDNYSEDDKKIIAEIMEKKSEYINVKNMHIFKIVFLTISLEVLRKISSEFSDASVHDWTEYFSDINATYMDYRYKRILDSYKQEEDITVYFTNGLIKDYEQNLEKIKEHVLDGKNYEYNREEVENELYATA
jgi:hypothetical protein